MEYKCLNKWEKIPELHRLLELKQPPKELYYQGSFEPQLFASCATVVGSRKMTTYGRQVIEKLIPQLVFEGKTVVSGFMYGVDQTAHQTCLNSGGKTIAVLGWGIKQPLDGYDANLAKQIINNGGLLISEWLDQPGTLWTFPVRDRIVAALSDNVYVIEAAAKSGSLITAEAARKLNRQVWAVPGPITSRTSEGTNTLINQGKAKIWTPTYHSTTLISNDPILNLLLSEPLTVDEIALKLNQSVAEVGAQLSLLSLSGQIIERDQKYYAHQT